MKKNVFTPPVNGGIRVSKKFRTYNQQMRYLRDSKNISCEGTDDKIILCRNGYFNLINGYKTPFTNGRDHEGRHLYLPKTSIKNLHNLKLFDDELRLLLLKYITKAEEEIRAFVAYKFDEVNKMGKIPWYTVEAFNNNEDVQKIIGLISRLYSEVDRSRQNYIRFYIDNHQIIPTWILIKVISFSSFINLLNYSKKEVKDSICNLYRIKDKAGSPDERLLIGSLHWMRTIRNACAHNERVYDIKRENKRIKNTYLNNLPKSYTRDPDQKIIDLVIYLKFYLDNNDFIELLDSIKLLLIKIKNQINSNAFDNVRGGMGIKDVEHLDILAKSIKKISYNKF